VFGEMPETLLPDDWQRCGDAVEIPNVPNELHTTASIGAGAAQRPSRPYTRAKYLPSHLAQVCEALGQSLGTRSTVG
jgi:hypothetical protein